MTIFEDLENQCEAYRNACRQAEEYRPKIYKINHSDITFTYDPLTERVSFITPDQQFKIGLTTFTNLFEIIHHFFTAETDQSPEQSGPGTAPEQSPGAV